jgi:ElaB/YqjD/DUF883 family membrane-anchored ribosome-binding protein
MISPNGDEFMEDDPLAAQSAGEEHLVRTEGRLRNTAQKISETAGDTWEQAKMARERTEVFLRENPVPTILGALAIGLAIGLAIRYASSEEKEEAKAPLGNLNWSFLTLPFLWPLFKVAREKFEDTSDALTGRSRSKIDIDRYTKPIRKRWKAWTD